MDSGYQHFESISTTSGVLNKTNTNISPRGGNVGVVQTLYNGQRTGNLTRQAEASVLAGRETLRNAEQTALLDAATQYMNVLRDTALLDLQRRNVQVLQEQLKQARDRFNVGEVTRTDVAQAESRLAASQSQVLAAEADLKTSQAAYRRAIGVEPINLRSGMPVDRLSPRSLEASVAQGTSLHPTVAAAQYTVDAAQHAVKAAEGTLYPTVTLEGNVQRRWDVQPGVSDQLTGTVLGRVAVPLYQGGSEYSIIRQTKETLGQRRIELDVQRDIVRATVFQWWSQLEATKAQIISAQAQVTATEVALNGVREEARVGQRTTLDVLNAQQELVNARVALVRAQRDRVVASYTLLASVGRLAPEVLSLPTETYDSRVHYHQVRDKWIGVRNPDGR
jgi:outer membrane protein